MMSPSTSASVRVRRWACSTAIRCVQPYMRDLHDLLIWPIPRCNLPMQGTLADINS